MNLFMRSYLFKEAFGGRFDDHVITPSATYDFEDDDTEAVGINLLR